MGHLVKETTKSTVEC